MNKTQFFGIFLLVTIALYGMSTAIADPSTDGPKDGTGEGRGSDHGNHRGSMDGDGQKRDQMRDESGLGGMWGNNGTGICLNTTYYIL